MTTQAVKVKNEDRKAAITEHRASAKELPAQS